MFKKILIANRGEIACRVATSAKKMGIATVAVYSEADARARHVSFCDEAVLLGEAAAKESYLRIDKIIAAALKTGAQAIHPGYGFLSENDEFAKACEDNGIVLIGPSAESMRAMGSKSAAKALMEKAGVPLVPGYHGDNQDPDFLQQQADKIGYPVLLKASAGGGGKGMRVVNNASEFKAALASCQREAQNSFGDDHVLLEKYLQKPRHIEIQVFADQHGNTLYLFERDCSVQRRHQKVLEEAPAPQMDEVRRQAMGQAAVAAAKAVNYVGAGTVEFIVDADGTFYFMEMNTRLQVEHPVTEMITQLDLVEWQIRVAAKEPLPLTQAQLQIKGHAIEARIYAENPENGFLPSIGRIDYMSTPVAVEFAIAKEAGDLMIRIDSGVRSGDEISPFYDPMIAKLIVWANTREQALQAMSQALDQYHVVGPANNIAFLKRLIHCPSFAQAQLDTGLIEHERATLLPPPEKLSLNNLALAVAAILAYENSCDQDQKSPWGIKNGWRMHGDYVRHLIISEGDTRYPIKLSYLKTVYSLSYQEQTICFNVQSQMVDAQKQSLELQLISEVIANNRLTAQVVTTNHSIHLFTHDARYKLRYLDPLHHETEEEHSGGGLSAPMPGKVIAVLVEKGHLVKKGMPLLIIEAMKMEHTITAPQEGVVKEILYRVGDQVADGKQLLTLEAHASIEAQ